MPGPHRISFPRHHRPPHPGPALALPACRVSVRDQPRVGAPGWSWLAGHVAVCACGWHGDWRAVRALAVTDGAAHLAGRA